MTEVVQARTFEMEGNMMKKILLFNGQSDLTFLELKTWRSFLYSLVGANKAYVDHLTEATDGLKMFSEFCKVYNTGTGKYSQPQAERVSQLVENMADFHKEVFGDFKKYTSPEGPFADVLQSTDVHFKLLQKQSKILIKEHRKMEKETETAYKSYMKTVKRKARRERKLSHLCDEQMRHDKRWMKLERKQNLAYSMYTTCHGNEVRHRTDLEQQTEELKKEFLAQEQRQLDIMFSLINRSLSKLHKLIPRGLENGDDLNFETENQRTRNMAQKNWQAYMREHTFPERKDGTLNPNDFDEEDEDTDSEEGSDDEDSDDSADGHRRHRGVLSLRAPKLTNEESGMNDVLKEILASLGDQQEGSSVEESKSSVQDRRVNSADHLTQASSTVQSDARRRRREAKVARKDDINSQERKKQAERIFNLDNSHVGRKENVTVYALKDWNKTNSGEISVKVGMKLKQTKAVNDKGMAYGYKKNKVGFKKYGFYPADMVTLSLKDARKQ